MSTKKRFAGAQSPHTWKWLRRLFGVGVFAKGGRVVSHGADNVPCAGPSIIAYSHRGNWDALLIARALPKRGMRLVGKDRLPFFRVWIVRSIVIRIIGIVPVPLGRTNDGSKKMSPKLRGWLEERALHTERGGPVGVALEGGVHHSWAIAEKLSYGTASWALKFGVPVVLCGIGGAERYKRDGVDINLRSRHIHVVFSEPVDPVEWLRMMGHDILPADEGIRRELYAQFTEELLRPLLQTAYDRAEKLAQSTRRHPHIRRP